MNELASFIDHTNLLPDATKSDIEQLCREAIAHHFYGVCVQGCRLELARSILEESDVKLVAVVGFPHGACESDAKRFEAEGAVDLGAHELDVVLNIGRLKEKDFSYVLRELRDVVEAAEERPVKVILETALLSRDEKITACELAVDSGARFVKTSTGFAKSGATVDDVRLMREIVGVKFGVKASGGIRDAAFAQQLIEAGATRLGTSSGVQIVRSSGNPGARLS